MAIKQGSLSAAADELNITQPAVTKGIQRLQEYYEVKFVERFGRKLELTFAGKGLYEISEKIFELEGLAEDYLRDFQQHKRGHIRIVSIFKYLEFSNNEAIKRAVESGVGIAIISEKVASEEIKSGKLKAIQFSDAPIRRKFYMVYNTDKFISASLQSLIDSTFRWAARFLQVSF